MQRRFTSSSLGRWTAKSNMSLGLVQASLPSKAPPRPAQHLPYRGGLARRSIRGCGATSTNVRNRERFELAESMRRRLLGSQSLQHSAAPLLPASVAYIEPNRRLDVRALHRESPDISRGLDPLAIALPDCTKHVCQQKRPSFN